MKAEIATSRHMYERLSVILEMLFTNVINMLPYGVLISKLTRASWLLLSQTAAAYQ